MNPGNETEQEIKVVDGNVQKTETGKEKNLIIKKIEKWKKDRQDSKIREKETYQGKIGQETHNIKGPKQPGAERDMEL